MRRFFRRRTILVILATLVGSAALGVWIYTRSDAAARSVKRKLEDRIGANVQFDTLAVGLTATTIHDLRIHEPAAVDGAEPFLTAQEAEVDVGIVGAMRDQEVKSVRLKEAQLLLRFDQHGNLATNLPGNGGDDSGSIPNFEIESGTLTIRQEGRTDSVFRGIDLNIEPSNGSLSIKGEVDDASWGRWHVDGSIPLGRDRAGRLAAQTQRAQTVTPDLLRQVPLVNPNVWNHVRLEGSTTARFVLSINPAGDRVTYRIDLDPTNTTVDITGLGMRIAQASGNLIAEGSTLTLTNVRGSVADGDIKVDSIMDFSGPDSVLRFRASLFQMEVQKLPKSWQLPEAIDGKLSGKVNVALTLPSDGDMRLEAAGRATITEARLNEQPVPPIDLKVGSHGNGAIAFSEPLLPSKTSDVVKPSQPDTSGRSIEPPGSKTRRPGFVASALRLASRIAEQPNTPDNGQDYLPVSVTLREVEFAELLKAAGAEGSIPVGGKTTVKLQVDIPTNAPDDFKLYRLAGTITSRRLMIDELVIEDVSGTLGMPDGKLLVNDLTGQLPRATGGAGGTIVINGQIDPAEPYSFRASARLEQIALQHFERLRSLVPTDITWEGELNARAELHGTLSPMSIQTSGKARVDKLKAGAVPANDLTFAWKSDSDMIRFTDTSVQVFGGTITGDIEVPLREDVASDGIAKIQDLDLGKVTKTLLADTNIRLEGRASGSVKMRAPAAGVGPTAELELQSTDMKFQGVSAKRIKGTGTFSEGVFRYNLASAALGGQVEVSGQYPPAKRVPPKPPAKIDAGSDYGKLRVKRIRLSALWDLLGVKTDLASIDAEISGDFPLTVDAEGRLVGDGTFRAERLRWKDKVLAIYGQGIIRLTSKSLTLDQVTLFAGEGVARIVASFKRSDPDRSEVTLALTNVPADRVFFLFPEMAKRFDMNVSGRLTSIIGREWRGSGILTSTKGKVYGIPVTEFRAPIYWVATPGRGRAEIRVREARAASSGGIITARAEANMFSDLPPRLSGDVQFRNANVSQVFRDAGRVVGNLRITGKLDFSSEQYRGPEDLTAKFIARLGESQPFSLPVFEALVPFLGIGRDYSTTIREGDVHAVLGRGVWRVQQLTLSGPSLDLYADGTVNLDGRLNGSVVARSGERPSQTILRRFMPASPLAGLTPNTLTIKRPLLTDVTSLVGRYVAYLEVTGTVDSPIVRLQVLRTLSEAAVRFFLFRFLTALPS